MKLLFIYLFLRMHLYFFSIYDLLLYVQNVLMNVFALFKCPSGWRTNKNLKTWNVIVNSLVSNFVYSVLNSSRHYFICIISRSIWNSLILSFDDESYFRSKFVWYVWVCFAVANDRVEKYSRLGRFCRMHAGQPPTYLMT